ncbi:hypothetical protein K490DRAFT_55920 [Saccharata proteae CBS 121410]|uniref:Uncharacterized protein n=1 Tax=Saccharata proteae CBS 121410 TaxID=1314787 RepID=A0A9P4HUX5_9PEZI|nr:hypothetical protein K490DRAFT_55920 [Saccharata proteae CBS 121410]
MAKERTHLANMFRERSQLTKTDSILPEYRLSTCDLAAASDLKRLLYLASGQAFFFLHSNYEVEEEGWNTLQTFNWMPTCFLAVREWLQETKPTNAPPDHSTLIDAATDVETYLWKLKELEKAKAHDDLTEKKIVKILSNMATRLERKSKDDLTDLVDDNKEDDDQPRTQSQERGRTLFSKQDRSLGSLKLAPSIGTTLQPRSGGSPGSTPAQKYNPMGRWRK